MLSMANSRPNQSQRVWMFDGIPDHVDRNVSTTTTGGYILAVELSDGTTRIASTSYPAKYVANWRANVRRFNVPPIARVLISWPLLRYSALKRALVKDISSAETTETGVFKIDAPTLTTIARDIFQSDVLFKNSGS